MLTPQLAGVSLKDMGAAVADLSERRNEIIAALDLLITGISIAAADRSSHGTGRHARV